MRRRDFFKKISVVSAVAAGSTMLPRIVGASSSRPVNGSVSLSFDDGLLSVFRNAVPLLREYYMHTTFFPVTNWIGGDEHMTGAQLKALYLRGHEIGCHTRSHPHIEGLSAEDIKAEIEGARADLAAYGVKMSRGFAGPYGEDNPAIAMLIQSGLIRYSRHAFQESNRVSDLFNFPGTFNPAEIIAVSVRRDTPLSWLKRIVSYAGDHRLYLVLVFHGVRNTPQDEYDTSTETFRQLIEHIGWWAYEKDDGLRLRVRTIANAVQIYCTT